MPLKACKVCQQPFKPWASTQTVCGFKCAEGVPKLKRTELKRKEYAKDARQFRRAQENKRAGLNRNAKAGDLRAAQDAFNEFIRARDHSRPCIVHGHACFDTEFHAGHFCSVGSHPAKRFNTWNCWKQCSSSNKGAHNRKHFKDSVSGMYRKGLIDRIGLERVEWLERDHPPKQYKSNELQRIAKLFRRRARHYRKLRGIE